MKKNLRQCLNRLLATFVILLAALPSSAARSYVFALNGDDESVSPSYYYGDYQKAEQTKATYKYNQVTGSTAPSDWSGTYLLVGESTARAYNGSITGTNSSAKLNTSAVTISSSSITTTDAAGDIELIKKTGTSYYYIKINKQGDNNDYYLYTSSTGATILSTTVPTSDTYGQWSLSLSGGVVTIANVTTGMTGYKLKFYTGSTNQYTFWITNTSNTTNYKNTRLFKKQSNYTVTYDANGGSGTMTDSDNPYINGSTITVLGNEFTAPAVGQGFARWNTAPDGSGTYYEPGETFSMPANNVTLYAQWGTVHDITVTSNLPGVASVITNPEDEAAQGRVVTVDVTPNTGYALDNITATDGNGDPVTLTLYYSTLTNAKYRFTMPDSDVTITATFYAQNRYYRKVTGTRTDWSGTYLMAGQTEATTNPTTTYVYDGTGFGPGINTAINLNVYDGFITNPSGGVEVKIEYIKTETVNSINSKWYCFGYDDTEGVTHYLGNNSSSSSSSAATTTTKPTTSSGNAYLWKMEEVINNDNNMYDYGSVNITNRYCYSSSGYSYSAHVVFSTLNGYKTFTSSNSGYSAHSISGSFGTPKFYEKVYKVTVSDMISNGTVEIDKEYAAAGETVTVTTHPNTSYATTAVTYTPTNQSASSATGNVETDYTFTFTMPDRDVVVGATFGAGSGSVYHSITCVPSSDSPVNGYITADQATAAPGTLVSYEATPESGYKLSFVTVTDGSSNVIPAPGRTFVMPASDVTITAEFCGTSTISDEYTIGTIPASPNWNANQPAALIYNGTSYHFAEIIYLGSEFGGQETYITDISWYFDKNSAAGSGYMRMYMRETSNSTFTSTTADLSGFDLVYEEDISGWGADGIGWYKFHLIQPFKIDAEHKNLDIAVFVQSSGTSSKFRWMTNNSRTNCRLYRLNTQYTLVNSDNPTAASANQGNYYPPTKIETNSCLTVPKITIDPDYSHGTVTTSPADEAPEGTLVTINAVPDPGYSVELVVTDGNGDEITVTDGKFTMPDTDVTIQATFTAIPYNITVVNSDPSYGIVSVSETNPVYVGQTISIHSTSLTGYMGTLTLTDGSSAVVPINYGADTTFVMPASDVTLTSSFKLAYVRQLSVPEDDWAGIYVMALYNEAKTVQKTITTAPTSTQYSTGDIVLSEDCDTILSYTTAPLVFAVEYGGVWSAADVDICGESFVGRPYYYISFKSANTKRFIGSTGGTTINTIDNNPPLQTSNTRGYHRWALYKNGDNFLMKCFPTKTTFLYGNNSSGTWTVKVKTSGNDEIAGYEQGTTNNRNVYLYKDTRALSDINKNVVGNGWVDISSPSVSGVPSGLIRSSSNYVAYEGTTITLTTKVEPNAYTESYNVPIVELKSLTVKDSDDNPITLTEISAGVYQFAMPDKAVSINAVFDQLDCMTEGEYDLSNPKVSHNSDGSTSANIYSRFPYVINSAHSYKQILYSSATNPGGSIPSMITSIGFLYHVTNTASTLTKNNVRVYMGDTDDEILTDWVDKESLTLVYEGPMSFPNPTNNKWVWNDFTFNQNGNKFVHDQSKNLIVTIHDYSNNADNNNYRGFFYQETDCIVQICNASTSEYGFDENGQPTVNNTVATKNKSFYYPITHFCGLPTYTVTCATGLEGGEISASPNSGLLGDGTETVTITAVPETGYEVNSITATNETTGATITLSGSGNTRTFTMPEANVNVTATFRPEGGGGDTWVDNVTSQPAGYVVDGSGNVTISSAEGLAWLISVVNGYNGCTADNLEGKTVYVTQPTIDMFEHIWVPIGYSSATPFSGTFDGQCNVISGLHIDQDSYQEVDEVEDIFGPMKYAGMFGYTKGATIKNTFVFLGSNDDEHGHRDWMTCKHDGGYLGMLVGYGEDLDMEFCYAANALGAWGNLNSVGGLVGCAHSDNPSAHVIKASMANGHFFYKNTGPSIVNLGGLVGSSNIPVENCFAIPMDSRYCSAYTSNLSGFTAPTITNKGAIVGSAGATSDVTNVYSHPFATDGFDKIVGNATGTLSNTKWYAVDTCTTPYTNVTTFTKATERTYGSYSTNNTIDGTPFCDTLNSNIAANYGYKWITPPTTSVNGGYPLIVRPNDVAGSVLNSYDAKHHLNVLIFHDVNTMPSILQALDDGSKEGDNSSFGILMYSNGEFDADLEIPADANFFIDENVAVKQDGNGEINAAVGVTFDNSTGNGEMHRDWHMFSSAIEGGKIGINYGQQTSAYPTITNDLKFGIDYSLVQNDDAVYFPDGITVANGNDGTEFDIYSFYEPQYHWINLKRASGNHWHEDSNDSIAYGPNETTFIPGKGYLLALGNNTTADNNFMQAKGVLNNGLVTIPISAQGSHLKGYNLLGNPYQSYLDFNEFADVNASVLWNSGEIGNQAYLTYNADKGGFVEYLVDGNGVGFSQGAATTTNGFLHPHQGFFVLTKSGATGNVTFNNDMRSITGTSEYRDAQPHYPLVNLICTDSDGKKEVSIIEVERPSMAGSLKMKEMLNAKANMYVRWGSEDFSSMFIDHRPDYVPVWFKSVEEGVFTMTWSTANDNFGYLHLIDNLTGNDIDMLTADSYAFQSRPSDSKARFRLVFSALGIEEETTEHDANFAFINGNELVVTGEGELSLIDLNGRVLATEYVSGQQSHIAMPEVAVGMYMLRLANSDGVKVQKIVVRK